MRVFPSDAQPTGTPVRIEQPSRSLVVPITVIRRDTPLTVKPQFKRDILADF